MKFILILICSITLTAQDTTLLSNLIVRRVVSGDTVRTIVTSQQYNIEEIDNIQEAIIEHLQSIKAEAILPPKNKNLIKIFKSNFKI